MALDNVNQDDLGKGGIGMGKRGPGSVGFKIQELQGLKVALVAGTTAATNIAIAGIQTTDTILHVLHLTAGAAAADLTAEASVTSAGNIQLSTTDTSADQLQVWYYTKPAN